MAAINTSNLRITCTTKQVETNPFSKVQAKTRTEEKESEGKMVQEETRKGPWTEHEDVQLVFYVNLFGDRRWDFIAKVSGLKVAGDKT